MTWPGLFAVMQRENISKFLRFRVANRQLKFSNTYIICLQRLVNQEISNKCNLVRATKQNLNSMKDVFYHEVLYWFCTRYHYFFWFRMIQQFLKYEKLMVRNFTVCFLMLFSNCIYFFRCLAICALYFLVFQVVMNVGI